MKIQAISNFNRMQFGNFATEDDEMPYHAGMQPAENRSFYAMSNRDKLDHIYDMLIEQKQDLITLSKNQEKMQRCNDNASMVLLNNIRYNGSSEDAVLLGNTFDSNRIDILA